MQEIHSDVLIVGASLGGCAAALSAARSGASVVLIEETDWGGGQLTAQGVCTPDENRWVEAGGGTASYRAFRKRIRAHYRSRYRLSEFGAGQELFNPGNCWVSAIAMEPKVARDELTRMLQAEQRIQFHLNTRVIEVERRVNRVTSLVAANRSGECRFTFEYVLDATDLGDLLPLAGVAHTIGAESRAETGEPDAPQTARPDWIQPFTFPFALEMRPEGENHTIPRPPDYEELRALQRYHILDGAMRGMFGELGWWTYRRILAAENFDDPAIPCDVAMINTPSNDYHGELGVQAFGRSGIDPTIVALARRASLGYVYWLQAECPRVDEPGAFGYPEFQLRTDLFDTSDGVAPSPYIRESRRIKALKTILELEVVARDSSGIVCQPGPRAAFFPDSCGIGHYWLDVHQGASEEPERLLETRPFQIPLGALIPKDTINLLAACKNIGTTHLTNGCYRLHPIEWNIGESAGALAAFCVANRQTPHQVHAESSQVIELQRHLLESGIPVYWWTDLPAEHPAFMAAQTLAMRGIWTDDSLQFRPEEPFDEDIRARIQHHTGSRLSTKLPGMTRGDAAIELLAALNLK